MASQALKARLERLAKATAAKLCEKERVAILREYERELEQVGPAPGRPWEQHDTMVRSDPELDISHTDCLLSAGVTGTVRGRCEGPG